MMNSYSIRNMDRKFYRHTLRKKSNDRNGPGTSLVQQPTQEEHKKKKIASLTDIYVFLVHFYRTHQYQRGKYIIILYIIIYDLPRGLVVKVYDY